MDEYIRKAIVTKVVDGDTIDAIVDLGYHVKTETRFRFANVDAPEIYGKNATPEGFPAKQFVEEQLLGKEVYIKSLKTGKYGRWIADIYIEKDGQYISFNQLLVDKGFAVIYE